MAPRALLLPVSTGLEASRSQIRVGITRRHVAAVDRLPHSRHNKSFRGSYTLAARASAPEESKCAPRRPAPASATDDAEGYLSPEFSALTLGLLAAAPCLGLALLAPDQASADVINLTADATEALGYSQASYYMSLVLFVISIPGLWSLIKRATKSKIVRRTFEVPGPKSVAASGGKSMAQLAGQITSILNRSNYKVAEAKEVVTFEGNIMPSRSQAAFLVFCTALSLASVALVLSITNPGIGDWWYSMILLSPLAGVYYWRKAARTEQIQVKIVISDDEQTADIIVQGDEEEIERLRRELGVMEKGLEYVKGIFEG